MTLHQRSILIYCTAFIGLLAIQTLLIMGFLDPDGILRDFVLSGHAKGLGSNAHRGLIICTLLGSYCVLNLLFAYLIHLILRRMVFTPVGKLNRGLKEIIQRGNRNITVDISGGDEFVSLTQSINEVLEALDQADKIQAATERRYHTVVKQSSEGILLVDARTRRLLEANPSALNMLGLDKDTYTDLTLDDLPDDGNPWIDDPIHVMERTGLPFFIEKAWSHPRGEMIHAEINMQLIEIHQEKILVLNIHDITRHWRNEKQNRDREKRLSEQNQALTDLARKRHYPSQSLVEKFEGITEKTVEILHCHRAGIWEYDWEMEAFKEVDGYLQSGGHEYRQPITPEQLGALYPMVLEERTVVIENVNDCPFTKELNASLFQPQGVGAFILVCIHFDGQPWGALSVQMEEVDRDWAAEDVQFAVSMADYASLCIQESVRDKAEKNLKEREQKFSLLAQNVLDIIYRVRINPELSFEYISPAFETIMGYPASILMENPDWILDHVHPDDIEMITHTIENPEAQDKSFVIRTHHKDGRPLWLEQRNVYVYDDKGDVIALEGISRDITERKLYEAQFSHRLAIEEAIAEASRILLTPQGGDLNQILMHLGECVTANRAYIFEFDSDLTVMSNTYEWCAPLTEPMIDELQAIPLNEIPWFYNQLCTQKVLIIPDIDQLATIPEAAKTHHVLSMQQILSLIIVSIRDNSGTLTGFLGFDDTTKRRDWSVEDIRILTIIAEMIGNYWDRRRSEKNLIESQQTLSNLMSNIPGMAYRCRIDEYWTMEFVSHACKELTGYPPESLILNRDIAYVELILPEDRPRVLSHVERAVATRERFFIEYRIIDRHQNIKWVAESGCALWDQNGELIGLDGLILDVSEQRLAQQALKKSEERHRLLAENLTDIIWSMDLDFNYTYISPAVFLVRGYTQEEAMQQPWMTIVWPDDRPQIQVMLEQIHKQRLANALDPNWKSTIEVQLQHKDGHYLWTEIKITTLVDDEGQPIGFLGVSRDISDRKQAEQNHARLEARIQEAQKLESLGLMAGGIAHDFNNLLMGVLGNAGLLMEDLNASSPLRDRVEQIELAARRAAELTNQMLAYSGKGRFVVTRLDINQLILETIHLLQSVISSKAVIDKLFFEEPLIIEADASQIRQVVMNLITNASDALDDEGGLIKIKTDRIDVDQTGLEEDYLSGDLLEGRYAILTITDTGCGMDQSTCQRIFDPFFTTKFTGRGLGLAAVLGIVRGHHGVIKVESQPGVGTTFRVLIPCSESEAIVPQESRKTCEPNWRAEGLILVADDENLIRNISSEILLSKGFEVLTAGDGLEAMEIFEEHGDKISAVLLDLVMPHMDGAETYRQMKQARPDLPILLSSGYCEEEVSNRFPADAFLDFIQKPYLPKDLIDKVQNILQAANSMESTTVD